MWFKLSVVALAVSLLGNLAVGRAYVKTKEELAATEQRLDTATAAARSCSESVERMATQAQDQAKQARKAVEAAQGRARALEAAARAELTRQQAVPGDACKSAQVETAEWLAKRRAPVAELPEGSEASGAAVGTMPVIRAVGKALVQVLSNTTVNVEVKAETPK
jgi:hypothetical protein